MLNRILLATLIISTVSPSAFGDCQYEAGIRSIGSPNAAVTIVEFSDFECPVCKRAAAIINQKLVTERSDVRILFRNYPLSIHPHAKMAAELGACIAKQSNKGFWLYHDYVFEHQDDLSEPNFVSESLSVIRRKIGGLSTSEVESCLISHGGAEQVNADLKLGDSYGVGGTPTLFINDIQITGIRDRAYLNDLIERAERSNDRKLKTKS